MMDQFYLALAEYKVALANNSVTDEIRNNYFLQATGNQYDALNVIFSTCFKKVDSGMYSTVQEAVEVIMNDYVKSGLEEKIGFPEFEAFVSKLVDEHFYKKERTLESLKEYLEIVKNDEIFTANVCFAILNFVLIRNKVEENIAYTQSIIAKIKDLELSGPNTFVYMYLFNI